MMKSTSDDQLSEKEGITVAPKQWFTPENPIKEWESIYCEKWIVL
jgi:hypothetical protein